MAYIYGTTASSNVTESVVTTNELAPIVGATGAVVTVFQKYARGEASTETVGSASLPTLFTGSMGTTARITIDVSTEPLIDTFVKANPFTVPENAIL